MKTFVVVSRAAGLLAAHDAGDAARGGIIGDDAHLGIERVGLAVERQQLFAVFGQDAPAVAGELVGIEHMQRPAAVMAIRLVTSTSAEIGRRPIDFRRSCTHLGDGPFFTPRIRRPANIGQAFAASGGKFERDRLRATGICPRPAVTVAVLQPAQARRRQIARDAVDAGAVAAIGRDARHRSPDRRGRAPRAAGSPTLASAAKFDDAVMVVGQAEVRAPNTACRAIPRRGWCRSSAPRR